MVGDYGEVSSRHGPGERRNTLPALDAKLLEAAQRGCKKLGLFRLAKKYGDARLEAARTRALFAGARSYRHVLTILQHNLDQQPLPTPELPAAAGKSHENVRGRDYYH